MKNLLNNFIEKVKNVGNMDFLSDEAKNSHKIPLMDLSFIPIGVVFYYFKRFIILASVFAFFTTILSTATGYNFICNFSEYRDNDYYYCSLSLDLYITFFLLRLLLTAVFLRLWYAVVVNDAPVNLRQIVDAPKQDLKIFFTLLVFIFVNILPIISFIILYFRVPNPDWRVETLFFAIVSIGFWFPFFAARFYSLPAFVLGQQKFPKLKEVLAGTSGNTLKILLALSIMLLLFFILFVNFNLAADRLMGYNILIMGIVFDFLYNILLLLFFAILTNHFIMQQGLLFGLPEGIETVETYEDNPTALSENITQPSVVAPQNDNVVKKDKNKKATKNNKSKKKKK